MLPMVLMTMLMMLTAMVMAMMTRVGSFPMDVLLK